MINQLNYQYQSWSRTPGARKTLRAWLEAEPNLWPWTLEKLGQPAFAIHPCLDANEMQASLVRLTQAGCERAALAISCQLAPGLKKLARTTGAGFQSPDEEVLSCFYEVLYSRDLYKRPEKIASNLILDTRQKVYRTLKKELKEFKITEILTSRESTGFSTPYESDTKLWVSEVINQALKSYSRPDERLLVSEIAFQHWVEGKSPKSISEDLQIPDSTIRTKIWRLRNKLRSIGEYSTN